MLDTAEKKVYYHCKHLLSTPHKKWQIPEDEGGNSMLDILEDISEQRIPDKVLDNEETCRMILGLVDNLPPEQRMSVLFYYYDEMSVKQIAEAMDTSEGTVKSRLNYARKSIKSGVEDYERKGVKLYSVNPFVLLAYFLRAVYFPVTYSITEPEISVSEPGLYWGFPGAVPPKPKLRFGLRRIRTTPHTMNSSACSIPGNKKFFKK